MFERDIQHALYDMRDNISGQPIMVANVFINGWGWECDLVHLSERRYITEYEIKRSRSDFFAERKKQIKCWRLGDGHSKSPKHFYFACPANMVSIEEVPDYAGLIYIAPTPSDYVSYYKTLSDYLAKVVKRAPSRRVDPLTDKQVSLLLQKGANRYWTLQQHLADKRKAHHE